MKHYIFLKLKDGVDVKEMCSRIEHLLLPLPEEIPGAGKVNAIANCVDRAENLDIMLEMPMESQSVLAAWMENPLHKALIAMAGPNAQAKLTFDCEA